MVKKILIIEDDRILLETAAAILKVEEYEVIRASDGFEGVAAAEKLLPDLIYCDIYMPGMNGYEVFEKLQSNYSTSNIPFIFMTSKAEKEDIRHGMNLGADDYITKPFNLTELRKTTATRLEKFEKTIKQSEVKYRGLFELAGDAIFIVKPPMGEIVDSNRASSEMLGYSKEELLKKNSNDLLTGEGFQMSVKHWQKSDKKENLTNFETTITRKNGQNIPVYASLTNIEINREWLILLIVRDITNRKLYERELIIAKEKAEESDRLKTSILANISHELRTPLNGILGFAEVLREELRDTDYEKMADNIRQSGHRLMITLNSIITLSQLESGRMTLSMKEFALQDGILPVVNSMKPLADEKQITIDTSGVKPWSVRTDEHLFKQLFRQLLDNSIKFTERGGITIETFMAAENHEEWLVIKITDTGIGISKDYFGLIFQEFRQVSEGFGREYQGSGIGLTICKKIIDLLKGKITLESEECIGSAFSIWLPYKQASPIATNTAGAKETAGIRRQKPRKQNETLPLALLVEDNKVNKDLIEYFLRKTCQIDYAADGETALTMARGKNYSIVLMDINLGTGKTGIEVVRELRKFPGYEKTPIIAVTGYAMAEDKDRLIEEGCSHYISKPFDKATLLALVEQALSGT